MLKMRGSFGRVVMAAVFGFICLCVLMQMLGTTMTLWDFDFQLDPVNAPMLEGFSLPAGASDLWPLVEIASLSYSVATTQAILQDRMFFRPPITKL